MRGGGTYGKLRLIAFAPDRNKERIVYSGPGSDSGPVLLKIICAFRPQVKDKVDYAEI